MHKKEPQLTCTHILLNCLDYLCSVYLCMGVCFICLILLLIPRVTVITELIDLFPPPPHHGFFCYCCWETEEGKGLPRILQDWNTSLMYVTLVATGCSQSRKSKGIPARNSVLSLCLSWVGGHCLPFKSEINSGRDKRYKKRKSIFPIFFFCHRLFRQGICFVFIL